MKIDCRACKCSQMDLFRCVMKCTKGDNLYCHYDNPKPFGQNSTRMIPDGGEGKCPGMEMIDFAGQPDRVR